MSDHDERTKGRNEQTLDLLCYRGVGARLWDAAVPWIVVVVTGLGTGLIASCLAILTAWLEDLRTGRCYDSWWLSRAGCCMGLDRQ